MRVLPDKIELRQLRDIAAHLSGRFPPNQRLYTIFALFMAITLIQTGGIGLMGSSSNPQANINTTQVAYNLRHQFAAGTVSSYHWQKKCPPHLGWPDWRYSLHMATSYL